MDPSIQACEDKELTIEHGNKHTKHIDPSKA